MAKSILGVPAYSWDRIINSSDVNSVSTLTQAYAIPSGRQYVGMDVFVQSEGREYQLVSLPASNPANWQPKGDGDAEDSYRATVGAFDPLIAGQHIDTDQTISSATLPKTKVYKLYIDVDCNVTFDLPLLCDSPMVSGNSIHVFAGDELAFFVTKDGSAIDVTVE